MSAPTHAQLLDKSCSQLSLYPNNIVHQTTPQHQLGSYSKRLKERDRFLFCEDGSAALDMLEYDDRIKGKNQLPMGMKKVYTNTHRISARLPKKCVGAHSQIRRGALA
jgi:hypothetical protein